MTVGTDATVGTVVPIELTKYKLLKLLSLKQKKYKIQRRRQIQERTGLGQEKVPDQYKKGSTTRTREGPCQSPYYPHTRSVYSWGGRTQDTGAISMGWKVFCGARSQVCFNSSRHLIDT